MHQKLEEYYDCANDAIDEVAESVLMIGGQPVGSLKDFMENTKIGEAKNEKVSSQVVFDALLQDFNILLDKTIKIKEEADTNKLYLISALMDNYIADYNKKIWMLKQSNE